MFKRFLAFTLGILLLLGSAMADLPDFASMSFDELNEMKQALDKEYQSRPESEGITLDGVYIVGKDLLPGTYYVAMVYPGRGHNVHFAVYQNEDQYASQNAISDDYIKLGEEPRTIALNAGYVVLSNGSVLMRATPFNPKDYYQYEPPAGTFVPEGQYKIGEDIPVGSYICYPGTVKGGVYGVYVSGIDWMGEQGLAKKEGYSTEYLYVRSEIDQAFVNLEEGDVLKVSDSLIMKKQEKLTFD